VTVPWTQRTTAEGGAVVQTRPLLAYLATSLTVDQCELIAGDLDGIVLTGRNGAIVGSELATRATASLRLLDPSEYTYAPRDGVQARPRPQVDWLAAQLNAKVAAILTPSHLVERFERGSLKNVIDEGLAFTKRAADACDLPSIVVVPIDGGWLQHDIDGLLPELTRVDGPVALAIADAFDPLDNVERIRGLLRLLATLPDVTVLRTDLASVGASLNKATTVALGMSTGTRHFRAPWHRIPQSKDRAPDLSLRVLVPHLWSYQKMSRLRLVRDDDGMLDCPCAVCEHERITRFMDRTWKIEAARHALANWKWLVKAVLGADDPESRFALHIQEAIAAHGILTERTHVQFDAPAQLNGWREFYPT
jgi:hypothetical protein